MDEHEIREAMEWLDACLREIHDSAESRSLDENEQKSFDDGLAEYKRLGEQLRKLEERKEEIRKLSEKPGHTESGNGPAHTGPQYMRRVEPHDGSDVRSLSARQAQDRAQKLMEDRGTTHTLSSRQMDHLQGTLRARDRNTDGAQIARRMLLTEHDHYRTAFQKVTTQNQPVLTTDEARAVEAFNEWRAAALSPDSAGGFGVPVVIDPTIILTEQGHPNVIMDIARVETITNDAWRGVNSAGVSWSFDGEASEVSDDTPTLAQPTVTAHKAQGFIPYSIEVGMDYPGFADEMSRLLGEGYNELLVDRLTVGTGTNEPTGIVTALDANTSVEVAAGTGSFVAADVYALWNALPIRYRMQSPTWLSGTDTQNNVRQFGTDSNEHAFTINLSQEAIPRLFGAPYLLDDYFPAFSTSTGSNILVVGDFRNYLVAQRAGMSVELVPHLFGTGSNYPTGQRGWYAWARVGGNTVNDNAFRILQGG